MRWFLVFIGLVSFSYYVYAAATDVPSSSGSTLDRIISIFILTIVIYILSGNRNNTAIINNIHTKLNDQQMIYYQLLTTVRNVNSYLENLNSGEIRNLSLPQLSSILNNYITLLNREIVLQVYNLRNRIKKLEIIQDDNIIDPILKETILSTIKSNKKTCINSLQMYRYNGASFTNILENHIDIDRLYTLITRNISSNMLDDSFKVCVDEYTQGITEQIYNDIINSNQK